MALSLITVFSRGSEKKLNNILSRVEEPMCRVPFGRVENREEVDTIPPHFTLSSWRGKEKERILTKIRYLRFRKFSVCVDSIDMMYGRQDSYVLYFSIRPSKALARLQNDIHALMPGASYFPGTATSHMTICVDKDYTKICAIKERLDARFRPFRMRISALELYELYPPVLLTKVD